MDCVSPRRCPTLSAQETDWKPWKGQASSSGERDQEVAQTVPTKLLSPWIPVPLRSQPVPCREMRFQG